MNGKSLLDLCQGSDLVISSTFFKHKRIHMYSRENTSLNQKSLMDYVIIERCMLEIIRDTRVYKIFGLDTDHYTFSKMNIAKSATRSYRRTTKRINVAGIYANAE